MEKFQSSGVEPKTMSLQSLIEITNNFSTERELGRGTYGKVYKGLLENGEEIAVKMLYVMPKEDDREQFMGELRNLWRLRHPNIVQLLGYCYEIKVEVKDFCGTLVPAENGYRALCFEFVQNGSLREHLYDESCGHDWQTRYKIIKGTCEGLKYLHEGLENPMFHLDLKPENILLDKNMVPKLADFGLSKLVDNNQTQATKDCIGSNGYMPPEYIDEKLVSNKYDIFSLGVVLIRIITGYSGYYKKFKMPPQEFIDLVYETWRNKLQSTLGCTTPKAHCHQVKTCIEIALDCVHDDRKIRPTIGDIIRRLKELEPTIDMSAAPSQLQRISVAEGAGDGSIEVLSLGTTELLDVCPLELHFPLESNKHITCPVSLINRTGNYVGVWITPICLETGSSPAIFQMMDPHSSWVKDMAIMARDSSMFEVVMIVIGSEEAIENMKSSMGSKLNMDSDLFKRVGQLGGEVHRAMLKPIICDPASCQQSLAIYNQKYVRPTSQIGGEILCTDVHPTETWIMLLNNGPSLSIFNYETQETVLEYNTREYSYISVKFIAREQWFATGDRDGWVRVYSYAKSEIVKEFEAYSDDCISTLTLSVHPTEPLLLTSSSSNSMIKLWDWDQGWKCTHTFNQYRSGVCHLTVNLWDTDIFLSASDGIGKVWDIQYGELSQLQELWAPTSFLYADSHRRFVVGRSYCRAKIWDFDTNEVVHKLYANGHVTDVACHPTLPLLAITTGIDIFLWDARTYRLEQLIEFTGRPIQGMVFTGTKELTRLVVPYEKGVAIFEINWPTLQMDPLTGDGN